MGDNEVQLVRVAPVIDYSQNLQLGTPRARQHIQSLDTIVQSVVSLRSRFFNEHLTNMTHGVPHKI